MNSKRIQIGDIVNVKQGNYAQATLTNKAILLQKPTKYGGLWVFEDCESNQIIETNEPCSILLLEKGGEQ
jgi:hypothetical protein